MRDILAVEPVSQHHSSAKRRVFSLAEQGSKKIKASSRCLGEYLGALKGYLLDEFEGSAFAELDPDVPTAAASLIERS